MSDAAQKIDDEIITDDIDADMRAALSELKTAGVVEDTPEATVTLDPPKEDKTRDETGKFAKVEEAKAEKPQRQTLTLPEKTDAAKADIQPAATGAAAPTLAPPVSWSAPMKENFGKLPAEVQAYIAQRESEAHNAISTRGDELKLYKDIKDTATPYLATMRAEGTDPAKAFGAFLNTAHIMRTASEQQKAMELVKVANSFRVSPQALLSVLQGGNVQLSGSSQPVGLTQEQVSALVQEKLEQQRQIQENLQTQRTIEAYGKDPAFKFFKLFRPRMGEILQDENAVIPEGLSTDDLMKWAYDKVADEHPEIRSIATGQQPAPAEQNRIAQATQAKTDAAKRAAGSVTGAPGGGKVLNGAGSVGSIEDDLRAAIREHSGRM